MLKRPSRHHSAFGQRDDDDRTRRSFEERPEGRANALGSLDAPVRPSQDHVGRSPFDGIEQRLGRIAVGGLDRRRDGGQSRPGDVGRVTGVAVGTGGLADRHDDDLVGRRIEALPEVVGGSGRDVDGRRGDEILRHVRSVDRCRQIRWDRDERETFFRRGAAIG